DDLVLLNLFKSVAMHRNCAIIPEYQVKHLGNEYQIFLVNLNTITSLCRAVNANNLVYGS
ncbi:hypothetical protein Q8G50_31900, partial [Klebsiella pneumoniae]